MKSNPELSVDISAARKKACISPPARSGNYSTHRKGRHELKQSIFLAALESVIAVAAGTLGLLTIFWQDWIETLTGWDPDRHSGGAEWLIVAILLIVAVITGLTARRGWRHLAAARG